MAQEKMFKAALEAIDQGQTTRARDLFTRLLKSDSSKAEYWLWMSTLVDSEQERIYCLESALRADPDNEAAKRGLIILGARQAADDVQPAPLIRRNWEKDLQEVTAPAQAAGRGIWSSSLFRLALGLLAAFIVMGVVFAITYRRPNPEEPLVIFKVSPFPTRTSTPSITPTITRTPAFFTPTPEFIGPTPLWMFLTQTYTPVPIYVNTPHPVIEAYRAGLRAFSLADWPALLSFMDQAIAAQPASPDLYYYRGEAFRMLGQAQDAVLAYGDALKADPGFAPAYLGRAYAYEMIDPKADLEGELNYAIQYDPYYVDAYLARARIRIQHHNPVGALEDLLIAESIFPEHPMVFVLRANAYLVQGDTAQALENALHGYELDLTSLPAYFTLAKVYLAQANTEQAVHYIDIYLNYVQQDAEGWAIKAQAEYMQGRYDLALNAANRGIAANNENAACWYYRGLLDLVAEDSHSAVNDLVNAVNLEMLNFDYSIALGRALWADERLNMAVRQFNSAELIASSDAQLAAVYYYRAQVYEGASNLTEASNDWERLLALPVEVVPADWRTVALDHWQVLNPSTATETPAPTQTLPPTITYTPTITRTPTPSRTPIE